MGACFWRRQTFTYHPVIGWWHLPNLRARIPLGQTFHNVVTNSAGMRASREYPKRRPAGRKRVVFLGDSYTAGDGVSNEDRFTDLLEELHPGLDVLNFGLNGSGTDQQLLIYEHIAREYEADAYVFCICVENIARNLYTCFPSFDWSEQQVYYRPKPYFDLLGEELQLRNQPVPRERRRTGQLGDWKSEFPYIPGEADAYAIYKQADGLHWRTMKAILQRLLAQVDGAPVLIVPMPMYNHYFEQIGPSYLPRFAELADPQRGVRVVDVLPALTAVPMQEREAFRFPDDPHYTVAAHAIISDALDYYLNLYAPDLLA
jgi:carbamoyltransferase